MKAKPGEFFSWAELEASAAAARLGLDNTAPTHARERLAVLVVEVLDPLRRHLQRPVRVTWG